VGILDFFSKDSRDKSALRRQAQKVTQRYGPPENRQKAIDQLGELGTAEALSVLCLRFTIRAEPGITDDEEKEHACRILVDAGEKAVGPVREFLESQESGVSFGLRVLAELLAPAEVVRTALRLLQRLGREYTRDPEKKLVLLSWLAEHHGDLTAAAAGADTGVHDAILPLLEDFSDDVRISAVRVLARQPLDERARVALVELYLRDSDNARVRGEVLQALAELGADVKGYRPSVEAQLVEPWYLDKEGRVKKRG
jgi:hypothetical protein